MKAIFFFLLLVFFSDVYAQKQENFSHDSKYYLKRSMKKKIPGFVLLAGGIVLIVSGIGASSSTASFFDASDLGPPLILGGFALTASGVLLLRSAQKDKIRAAELSAGAIKVPGVSNIGNSSMIMQPAIVLRLTFN